MGELACYVLAEMKKTRHPSQNFGFFALTKVFSNTIQMYAFDSGFHGDDVACDNATYNLSGTTLTMNASADCLGHPGSVKATAAIIQYNPPT